MKNLEEAVRENYRETIKSCEKSETCGIEYVKELIDKSFKNGVEFAQKWIDIYDELPTKNGYYLVKKQYDRAVCFDTELWKNNKWEKPMYVTHWRPIEIK